jgi:hypothetical protein
VSPTRDLNPAGRLLLQFREWEKRGRGWIRYPYPVVLEPPFVPFPGHVVLSDQTVPDDGRRPTLLSSLVRAFRPSTPPVLRPSVEEIAELLRGPEPDVFPIENPRIELRLLLRKEPETVIETGQLLQSLCLCRGPISFELIGSKDRVSLQLSCETEDERLLRQQLDSFAPDLAVLQRDNYLRDEWLAVTEHDVLVVEFGLSEEFIRPLRPLQAFRSDPLGPVIAALSDLGSSETAVFQVIFEQARSPWQESILRSVVDAEGKPFFGTGPEVARLAQVKVSRPLYAVVIRAAAASANRRRTLEILRQIASGLGQFAEPGSNELIPLENDEGYEDLPHQGALIYRCCQRCGALLNADELTALVHLPRPSAFGPKFEHLEGRTRAAPDSALGHSLVLGANVHNGETRVVSLSPEQRMRHTYLVGATGTGKSTLLLSMIMQDIEAGLGVAVLDPHGDLVDEICRRMPPERVSDCVLFDPADSEYPIGVNFLSAHSEVERMLLSSDLVSVFRRLSTSWGDQMHSVFANAIQAFLESSTGGTLADLRRFLLDKEYRAEFLKSVLDEEVIYYWQREFPLLKGNPQAPILTRLDTFLRPRLVRNLITQKGSGLDFRALLDNRGIFLGRLSQGAIGEDNAHLLGALLVAKFNQAALSRQEQKASARADFHLYIDEFHNFVTASVASLLTGVRKYRLGLTLAHQHRSQIERRESEVAEAVLSAHTRIAFRVSDTDARTLAAGFAHFEAADLMNLSVGEAIVRLGRAEDDFNLSTFALPPLREDAEQRYASVQDASRIRYARPPEALEPLHPRTLAPDPAVPTLPSRALSRAVESPGKAREPVKRGPTPALPGRGGAEHKYLQSILKRLGEDRGFKATLELPVLDARGAVDVALEREGQRIACEISVSTGTVHETSNITKCLVAGFDHVLWIGSGRALSRMKATIQKELSSAEQARVRCVAPEDVLEALDALAAAPTSSVSTVRGYTVSVERKAPAEAGAAERAVLSRTIVESMRRLRRKDEK